LRERANDGNSGANRRVEKDGSDCTIVSKAGRPDRVNAMTSSEGEPSSFRTTSNRGNDKKEKA
jgi:hypothetical protein